MRTERKVDKERMDKMDVGRKRKMGMEAWETKRISNKQYCIVEKGEVAKNR